MAYVLNVDLTHDYVMSLCERNGYTLVSTPDPTDEYTPYAFLDLDGVTTTTYGLISARNWLIERYNIMQSS